MKKSDKYTIYGMVVGLFSGAVIGFIVGLFLQVENIAAPMVQGIVIGLLLGYALGATIVIQDLESRLAHDKKQRSLA